MGRICEKLKKTTYQLGNMTALEFFAREGDWQTIVYADKVKALYAWEIDQKFEKALRKNLSNAEVTIGDSFVLAQKAQFARRFNMIVFDNPQGLYGESSQYCEHFEALETVKNLLSEQGIVIFNINHKPFNFDKQKEWQHRRENFYGLDDTSSIDPEFLLEFYNEFFKKRGFLTKLSFIENRNDEYLAYLVFALERQ